MTLRSFLPWHFHPPFRWTRHRWWQGGETDPGGWWQSGNLGPYGCGWQNGVFAMADADGVCGGSVGCGGGGGDPPPPDPRIILFVMPVPVAYQLHH